MKRTNSHYFERSPATKKCGGLARQKRRGVYFRLFHPCTHNCVYPPLMLFLLYTLSLRILFRAWGKNVNKYDCVRCPDGRDWISNTRAREKKIVPSWSPGKWAPSHTEKGFYLNFKVIKLYKVWCRLFWKQRGVALLAKHLAMISKTGSSLVKLLGLSKHLRKLLCNKQTWTWYEVNPSSTFLICVTVRYTIRTLHEPMAEQISSRW